MNNNRKENLLNHAEGKVDRVVIEPLIDRLIYMEEQLIALEKQPHYKIHPTNPLKQKQLSCGRQYISLSAQYNATLRTYNYLCGGADEVEEESPLRVWVKNKNANIKEKDLECR